METKKTDSEQKKCKAEGHAYIEDSEKKKGDNGGKQQGWIRKWERAQERTKVSKITTNISFELRKGQWPRLQLDLMLSNVTPKVFESYQRVDGTFKDRWIEYLHVMTGSGLQFLSQWA